MTLIGLLRARAAVALLVATLVPALLPGVARGEPIADKKAQAAAIAARIDELNMVVDRNAEAANGAQVALDQLDAQAADAQSRVTAAQRQLEQNRSELRTYAIDSYIRGRSESRPDVSPGDATASGLAEGYLVAAAADRQRLVDQLDAAQQDLQVQITQLDAARAAAATKAKDLAAKRAEAQAAVDQQRALYNQAQGELADLLRQEQARRAAEQAAAAARRAAQAVQQRVAPKGVTGGPVSVPPSTPSPAPVADPGPAPAPNGNVDAVIARAKAQLGKPYQWGAAGPDSFDCSGLTLYAWQAAGVSLPHYSKSQYDVTRHISLNQLQPGDLVFYNNFGHESMYIGDGQVIDAPHTGAYVQIVSLYWAGQPEVASRP